MGVKGAEHFHISNNTIEIESNFKLSCGAAAMWCLDISHFSARKRNYIMSRRMSLVRRQQQALVGDGRYREICIVKGSVIRIFFLQRWASCHRIWISYDTHLFHFRKAEIAFDTRIKSKKERCAFVTPTCAYGVFDGIPQASAKQDIRSQAPSSHLSSGVPSSPDFWPNKHSIGSLILSSWMKYPR